jgi:sterol desaturase/sphingolipid hydroxylase (fatty acid hydroxylase superfamily)
MNVEKQQNIKYETDERYDYFEKILIMIKSIIPVFTALVENEYFILFIMFTVFTILLYHLFLLLSFYLSFALVSAIQIY